MSIVKMKMLMTFPSLEYYLNDLNHVLYLDVMLKSFNFSFKQLDNVNELTQKVLGGFVCLIQIVGHVFSVNEMKYTIAIDLLWMVFVIATVAHRSVTLDPVVVSLVKIFSVLSVFLIYKTMKTKTGCIRVNTSKKMKNLANGTMGSLIDDDDTLDTDDDVSLSKFGLHNFTDSSTETVTPLNNSLINGRCFTPRSGDSVWSKPSFNSTFCVNTAIGKSAASVSDSVFVKPSFHKYQKLIKDDSDSELDESIGSLCIGSPKKAKQKTKSVFSLRKFTATPNFVAPTPLTRSRPLISPSKLGHSTSWVAGGYWGSEGERIFNIDGSRSSSQSSGFESQASSLNRNVFSQPPSREESVCGEPDKNTLLDRFQNCNMSNYSSSQTPQNFSRMSSPVFPPMQFNSHVHIPQPRVLQRTVYQPQYTPSPMFKAPGNTPLIKLPQVNTFMSH